MPGSRGDGSPYQREAAANVTPDNRFDRGLEIRLFLTRRQGPAPRSSHPGPRATGPAQGPTVLRSARRLPTRDRDPDSQRHTKSLCVSDYVISFGCDPAATPARTGVVVRLVARLLDLGDPLYRHADTGLEALPFGHAWSILAARRIYADLSDLIRQRGPHAWDSRSSVSAPRKVWLMTRALAGVLSR